MFIEENRNILDLTTNPMVVYPTSIPIYSTKVPSVVKKHNLKNLEYDLHTEGNLCKIWMLSSWMKSQPIQMDFVLKLNIQNLTVYLQTIQKVKKFGISEKNFIKICLNFFRDNEKDLEKFLKNMFDETDELTATPKGDRLEDKLPFRISIFSLCMFTYIWELLLL